MPTRSFAYCVSVAYLTIGLSASSAVAFDPDTFSGDVEEPTSVLRYGYNALKNGKTDEALGAFRFGAGRNHLPSEWKLARMLELGSGQPKDEWAAFQLFEKIASRYSEIPPNVVDRPYVADAVVRLGKMSLRGIEGSTVKADPQQAEFHFYRAAALYGSAEAQFQLGALYASGVLPRVHPKSSIRWYRLAARKNHAGALAALGQALFYGRGVQRSPAKGLAYLTRAAALGAKKGLTRFTRLQQEANGLASDDHRKQAAAILERQSKHASSTDIGREIRFLGLLGIKASSNVSN